jgi:hypothetical protein
LIESHEALEAIMMEKKWPKDFINKVKDIYWSNKASILVNGIKSPIFDIKSGTRQGCPLSPPIHPYRRNILPEYSLQPKIPRYGIGGHAKKVAAYADDKAVLVSSQKDLEIYLKL